VDEVESLGGPLICVEHKLADLWRGVDGLSIKPDPSARGARTDYECAYLIPNRYLSALSLARGAALILGDMPMTTGVWKNYLHQVIIWRFRFGEPEDDAPTLLASLAEAAFARPVETLEFSFDSPNVVIFDSSCPGDEAEEESVSFEIAPGKYVVTTHVVRPIPTAELVLHRFYPRT
jgi:hypothetical protein